MLVLVWYVANLGFNVGMKRSHALMPDVLVLTAFQFGAGAIAYGGAWLTGHAKLPHARWAVPLGCSAVLLLGGTLFTNASLILLSVSFTHVIKTCEPFFTVAIVYFWDGKLPDATGSTMNIACDSATSASISSNSSARLALPAARSFSNM